MKTKYLFLICTLCTLAFFTASCSDSDSSAVELSASAFDEVSSEGASLTVDIICNSSWTAESSASWCSISQTEGTGNQTLSLSVGANLNDKPRRATIIVTSHRTQKTVTVTQNAGNGDIDGYAYELPVYFHVLYNNSAQNVPQSRIETILTAVNKLYQYNNMNLTFKIAEIEPISSATASISCEEFMYSEKGTDHYKLMKDPNSYINVFLYAFEEDDVLGVSHLPLTTQQNYLEGLTLTDYSNIQASQLSNIYCVSINTNYINAGVSQYSPNDPIITLAHELGHYLGLHHPFAEDENGAAANECKDTDYCEDTPSYNKVEYDAWLGGLPAGNYDLEYLSQRSNCQGEEFISDNLMDYAYSLTNKFTKDQYTRVRHVLNYSPLIPGPKIQTKAGTRTSSEETLQIPFRMIQ